MNSKTHISESYSWIKDRVIKAVPKGTVSAVYLFGSRAWGGARADSDYDLLVLSSQDMDVERRRACKSAIRASFNELHVPIDIILLSPVQAEKAKEYYGSAVKEALDKGIAL